MPVPAEVAKPSRAADLMARLFSPRTYLIGAGACAAVFLVMHVMGLREATGILSLGIRESLALTQASLVAWAYVAAYLLFTLLGPVLVLAAALQAVISRARAEGPTGHVTPASIRQQSVTPPGPPTPHEALRGLLGVSIGVVSALHVVAYALTLSEGVERIGLPLALIAGVLAISLAWSRSVSVGSVLGVVVIAQAWVFVLYVGEASIPLPVRPLLVLTVGLYCAALVLALGLASPKPRVGVMAVLAIGLTSCVLGIEAAATRILASRGVVPAETTAYRDQIVEYRGAQERHPEMGLIPAPGSVTESLYPDDPRGYFGFRDTSWRLAVQPSSEARHEVTREGAAVVIDRAEDPTRWHVQLSRSGYALAEGTEYLLGFRVRAGAERSLAFAVGMDHPPLQSLGLYRTAPARPEWTPVLSSFRATQTDDSVRVTFHLGGDTADVHVADLTLRRADDGVSVEKAGGRQHFVSYAWNSRGCRAPEYAIPPPPGRFRIVVLGDSHTVGVGVHLEDTFTSVMERLLRTGALQTGDTRLFEVIGCGVRGFSTREERLYYEDRARAYQPDLLLVAMVSDDDGRTSGGDDDEFVHDPSKWEYLLHTGFLVQHLRHTPPEPDFEAAMTELAALSELASADGAELAVVLFADDEDEAWALLRESVYATVGALDVPVLDLHEVLMADSEPRDFSVHPIDGHPNEVAHGLAAEAIVDWLDVEGLTRSGSSP